MQYPAQDVRSKPNQEIQKTQHDKHRRNSQPQTTASLPEVLTTHTKAILIQLLTTHTRPLETSTADPKDSKKKTNTGIPIAKRDPCCLTEKPRDMYNYSQKQNISYQRNLPGTTSVRITYHSSLILKNRIISCNSNHSNSCIPN
jgi:hypothetical protein